MRAVKGSLQHSVTSLPQHGHQNHNRHADMQHQKQLVLLPAKPVNRRHQQRNHGHSRLSSLAKTHTPDEYGHTISPATQNMRYHQETKYAHPPSDTLARYLFQGEMRRTHENQPCIPNGVDNSLQRRDARHPSMKVVVRAEIPSGEPHGHVIAHAEKPYDGEVGE